MGGGTQRTTQTTEPGAFARPSLERLLQDATKQLDAGGRQFFPGTTIAGFDPAQLQAFSSAEGAAGGILPQLAQGGADTLMSAFKLATAPGDDPVVQRQIQAGLDPVTERFTQSILPNIRHGAIGAGTFGGPRQGFAETQAGKEFLRTSGDISNQILSTARGQGLSALNQLQPVLQAQLAGSDVLSKVGGARQQQEALGLAEQKQRFDFGQNEQNETLKRFAQLILPATSGFNTTT